MVKLKNEIKFIFIHYITNTVDSQKGVIHFTSLALGYEGVCTSSATILEFGFVKTGN